MKKCAEGWPQLNSRLHAYATAVRTSTVANALRRNAEKWPVYATVTGAAMAMASNVSASIIYSGTLNKTLSLGSSTPIGSHHTTNTSFPLRNSQGKAIGPVFDLALAHNVASSFRAAIIGLTGGSHLKFEGSGELLSRLSSGATISGAKSFGNGFHFIDYQRISSSGNHTYGWSRSKGFAGFSFFNKNTQQNDYGWIRLQYSVGANGLISSLTAVDYAYDDSGAAITAGQGLPAATPEPGTMALMLLATGAAGVEALRRRRESKPR